MKMNVKKWMRRATAKMAMFGLACLALAGCESYAIRGAVVEGAASQVVIVDKSDPRLTSNGLKDARIDVTIDPRAMKPKRQGAFLSGPDGQFEAPISEGGAGFLDYEAAIVVQRDGFMHAEQTMKLPAGNKRLLIILKPGIDSYKPETDIIRETIREGQRIDMLPRN